jgi:hypothetical protein
MCDKERLIGYLYDELPSSDRAEFERHLTSCSECRDEISQLGTTRQRLASWGVPDTNLDLAPVRVVPSTSRWFHVSRTWGLAAAAVLLLAVASAIANIEIRAGGDGVVIRTGWRSPATQPMEIAARVPPESPSGGVSGLDANARTREADRIAAPQGVGVRDRGLDLLEKRLSELEATVGARPATVASRSTATSEILRQVRQLVQQSETRQQRELALRIQQVVLEFNRARMADFSRMQSAVAQLQGRTDTALTNQLAMEKALIRTVQQER